VNPVFIGDWDLNQNLLEIHIYGNNRRMAKTTNF
jgi:hypothetical protein